MREDRAREVAEELMALPHVIGADRLAAEQAGREVALIEALTAELVRVGLDGAPSRVTVLGDMLAKAEGRLSKELAAFGGTPIARAKWARELAEGENLAASITRRRAEAERGAR